MQYLNNKYGFIGRVIGSLIVLVASTVLAGTPPFEVIRGGDAASVSSLDAHDITSTSIYEDAAGTLDDGLSYFYLVRDASQVLTISVHKNLVTQSVRLGFDDGDPSNAPVDPALSIVDVSSTSAAASGVAAITVTVTPLDGLGLPLGAGLTLEVSDADLLPAMVTGTIVDLGNGSYSFQVASFDPAIVTVRVSVEGLTLYDQPSLTFTTVFDTEFQVNPTVTGKQEKPVVGQAADGGMVVIWQGEDGDDKGIFGSIFDDDGSPVLTEFTVNSTTADKQEAPAVAVAADGSFVVVWQSPDVDDKGIFGQMFDADGTPLGTEFQVNVTETGKQENPNVAMTADGRFVVIWQSPDADDKGVFGQAFNAVGQAVGPEFQANTVELGKQDKPDLALGSDGDFVVVWKGPDADGDGVFGQRFDMNGLPVGSEFQANVAESGMQGDPRAAVSDNGQFMIVWRSDVDMEKDIYARRYDADGSPLGVEFVANSITVGNQDKPDVAMAVNGQSIVVWKSDNGEKQTCGQLFDAAGSAAGEQLRFSEPGAVNPDRPSVTYAADAGSFVVVWQAEDGDDKGVFARWILVP
jgi:hypothetical protein